MTTQVLPPSQPDTAPAAAWSWPIDLTRYDRSPALSDAEQRALAFLYNPAPGQPPVYSWPTWVRRDLERLIRPLHDVASFASPSREPWGYTTILRGMASRDTSFWAWPEQTWLEVLAMRPRCQRGLVWPVVAAYLFGGLPEPHAAKLIETGAFARRVFGAERVQAALARIQQALRRCGYAETSVSLRMEAVTAEVLLRACSPDLETLTGPLLATIATDDRVPQTIRSQLSTFAHALVELGILREVPDLYGRRRAVDAPSIRAGVSPEWIAVCDQWYHTTTLQTRTKQNTHLTLLRIGRWLAQTHPEVTHPRHWTLPLCAEYVAAVMNLHVGDWAFATHLIGPRQGDPLYAPGKNHYIAALRWFFQDVYEWGWAERRFDPRRALATPESVRKLLGANPRVIQPNLWLKLKVASLSLTAADLPLLHARFPSETPGRPFYPLALVRAIAVVWVFTGLRSDEIRRLRLGCVRRRDGSVPFDNGVLDNGVAELTPQDNDEYGWDLEVPTNKTSPAFPKPVPTWVVEAIQNWERERPPQRPWIDRKTGERVDFLFALRGRLIGRQYINRALIPLLCAKAQVPQQDARGAITSHRARAMYATDLAKAELPLADISRLLGHKDLNATLRYVDNSPKELAQRYHATEAVRRDKQIVEALGSQRAIPTLVNLAALAKWQQGQPTAGLPGIVWDLGPGFCTNPFPLQCQHWLGCAECSLYTPKGSGRAQLFEAIEHLQQAILRVTLTQEERRAIEEKQECFRQLVSRLDQLGTPDGKSPPASGHPEREPTRSITPPTDPVSARQK
jgi:integrase